MSDAAAASWCRRSCTYTTFLWHCYDHCTVRRPSSSVSSPVGRDSVLAGSACHLHVLRQGLLLTASCLQRQLARIQECTCLILAIQHGSVQTQVASMCVMSLGPCTDGRVMPMCRSVLVASVISLMRTGRPFAPGLGWRMQLWRGGSARTAESMPVPQASAGCSHHTQHVSTTSSYLVSLVTQKAPVRVGKQGYSHV